MVFGQILGGLAQTFILSIPSKVATIWFPAHEKAKATTIIALCGPLGVMIGFVMPGMFVKDQYHIYKDLWPEEVKQVARDQINTFMLV